MKARELRQLFGFREISGMPKINGHLSGYFILDFIIINHNSMWVNI